MGQPQILTRRARITGATTATALALLSAAWIVRDLFALESPARLWETWAGLGYAAVSQVQVYSALMDLVLFLLCATVAVTAVRSPSATSSLVAAGTLAVITHAPAVWLLADEGRFGALELRERALTTAAVGVGLGIGLLLLAAFGRRPPGESAGYSGAFGEDEEPPRPILGAAVTTLLFLGAAALTSGAWEIYRAQEFGWDRYEAQLTGTGFVLTPLSPPPAWLAWCTAALALTAVVATLQRASFARALGMTAAAVYLASGVMGVYWVVESHLLRRFGDLPTRAQLDVLTQFWFVLAGLVVLLTLCFAYERRYEPGYGGWNAANGTYNPPPPPSPAPPGW